ncbi:MAG: hypothetical protein U0105_00275 [Candidatus Obscuribacterales bacterium]|jgi:hypothetical protein
MAIQLSDRDMMIFKLIEEHQVLLEKHIAWFISCDDKPVLIRDRLRKLFYLDYLLCERHGGKLPWWTTPTKPLVYMLSPMTRELLTAQSTDIDLGNCDSQRHLLEVANLRMLFLVDQKDGLISNVAWTTTKAVPGTTAIDAKISFNRNGVDHRIGIINQPKADRAELTAVCEKALESGEIDMIWIVSRDDAHQEAVQNELAGSSICQRIAFVTHQDIYKNGIVKAKWQSTERQYASVCAESVASSSLSIRSLTPAQAC